MILKAGCRCDVHGYIEKNPKLMDKFTAFIMPKNRLFPGVAAASDPKKPATLHCCPSCLPKFKIAFRKGDMSLLPSGPLKKMIDNLSLRNTILRGIRRPNGGLFSA